MQQSLGELYFRQAFAIGKHLASQQDGIVGYGYAGKAVARTESGFTYTFECGGQGEFLQVVAMRKSVVLDVFHSFGQKNGGQTFTIGVSIISWLSVLYALNDRKVTVWILFRYEKVKI